MLLLVHPARAQSPEPSRSEPSRSEPSRDAEARAESEEGQERLSDEAELSRVTGLYEAGQYEECAVELNALLDPKGKRPITEGSVKETARIYLAACLIGSGQFEEADEPLRAAIRNNPQMKPPDSLVFPRPVIQRFLRVQQSMADEIRAAAEARLREAQRQAEERRRLEQAQRERVRQLERLASRETVIEKNERWIAAVPFGVGQFQNKDNTLGWFFFGTEVLTAGAALTSFAISSHIDRQAAEIPGETTAGTRAQDWYLAGVMSSWGFLALAGVGILEAQLSFVPEVRTVRKRELPPPPLQLRPSERESGRTSFQAAPRVSITQGGVVLGASGQF